MESFSNILYSTQSASPNHVIHGNVLLCLDEEVGELVDGELGEGSSVGDGVENPAIHAFSKERLESEIKKKTYFFW